MNFQFCHRLGTRDIRVFAIVSLGLHLALIFSASFLFSDSEIHRSPIRYVKVTYHPLTTEKKTVPAAPTTLSPRKAIQRVEKKEVVQDPAPITPVMQNETTLPIPLPVQNVETERPVLSEKKNQGVEKKEVVQDPTPVAPAAKNEITLPVPLPVRNVEKEKPPEEPVQDPLPLDGNKIAGESPSLSVTASTGATSNVGKDDTVPSPFSSSSLGEEKRNKAPGSNPGGDGLATGQGDPLTQGPGNGRATVTGGAGSRSSGEGKGQGYGGSSGETSGKGSGSGVGSSPGSGSGVGSSPGSSSGVGSSPGSASGRGAGQVPGNGNPDGGGSRKGTGIFSRLFSSTGGTSGAHPRYAAENPKPPYPREAREKGYQGEVLLRVEVLSSGRVGQIEVRRSSGHEMLDRSALSTVKQWRFVPAHKGESPIPLWVNVPIKFQLQ